MDLSNHNLVALFEQLGLENSDEAISRFVNLHKPLHDTVALQNAPFWNAGQAQFLQEAIEDDADWAEVVDTLDALLR